MAPRANWKGYLKLSLVSCAIALYPASSSAGRISFNTLNRKTGNKVKRIYVDPDDGEEVPTEDQVKGYPTGKATYVQVEDAELDDIRIESSQTIDIEKFVPRSEIDPRFMDAPYYIAPEDKVAQEAFAVIRDAMKADDVVGLGRVVISRRERIIMLEPYDKGVLGTVLRYAYEVRDPAAYFEDIPDISAPAEMKELAHVIIERKSGHFDVNEFNDRYEDAMVELIRSKRAGEVAAPARVSTPHNVVSLMDALKRSIQGPQSGTETESRGTAPARGAKPRAASKAPVATARKPAKVAARKR